MSWKWWSTSAKPGQDNEPPEGIMPGKLKNNLTLCVALSFPVKPYNFPDIAFMSFSCTRSHFCCIFLCLYNPTISFHGTKIRWLNLNVSESLWAFKPSFVWSLWKRGLYTTIYSKCISLVANIHTQRYRSA